METLKVQRAQLKSRLTRFKNYIHAISEKDSINSTELVEIEDRLANVSSSLREFEEIHFKITTLSDETSHENDMSQFEQSFYEITARAKRLISESKSVNNSNVDKTSSSDCPGPDILKLPSISLPTFSGQFENWVEFHDSFDSLINKNSKLSEVHKFYYLLSAVKGEAAQSLRSIKVSSENYNVAWNLLKKRYENKKLIVQSSLKALFNIEPIRKDSHHALQSLLDDVLKLMQCLKNYEQPTLDSLLIYIISAKFSSTTRHEWECLKPKGDFPTYVELIQFLEGRCSLLGSLEANKLNQGLFNNNNRAAVSHNQAKSYVNTSGFCHFCKVSDHTMYNCKSFSKLSVDKRIEEVKRLRLCLNCLRKNHLVKDCVAQRCKKCGKKHNTILHLESRVNDNSLIQNEPKQKQVDLPGPSNTSIEPLENKSVAFVNHSASYKDNSQTILSSACISVKDSHGKFQKLRVLLDAGSQSNFITQSACSMLGLRKTKCNLAVGGIGQLTSNLSQQTTLTFKSLVNEYTAEIKCFVLKSITDHLPVTSFNLKNLNIPPNIKLADTTCNIPGKIDLLIGAGLFWELLCIGQLKLGTGKPILQKTKLGWIIGGNMQISNNSTNNTFSCCATITDQDKEISDQISKFWELDGLIHSKNEYSIEEQYCEDHFLSTHRRSSNGRFIVSIPFKRQINELGESKSLALKRLFSVERKLKRDEYLKIEYTKFMKEYETLGHMSILEGDIKGPVFYLPHHAVLKESSTTTKVRVVFDASAKSTSNLSLNDIQCVGPTIQSDLFSILLRFRQHAYVITADIAKMYRQIVIDETQRALQLILWRENENETIKTYKLNTLTYGTACASFLATRCLKQLAIENFKQYPLACQVLERDFYVDDLLTGSDSMDEILQLHRDLSKVLGLGEFELRQWNSNSKEIISNISANYDHSVQNIIKLYNSCETKTLGILWDSERDVFRYNVDDFSFKGNVTKRTILSLTAQIFDPLGLLAPVVIISKLIIQDIWKLKLSWDETIPLDLHTKWLKFKDQLAFLKNINIPRHVQLENASLVELHGFSDASEKAYGACVYLRSVNSLGKYKISLLCAKSRVAPLKTVSLPRLELCGALILAQLVKKVREIMNVNIDRCYYWSDSTITLAWISKPPSHWKTFVANRVSEIQGLSDKNDWRHVGSKDNPADLISRGVEAKQLEFWKLWWNGPIWLSLDSSRWPVPQYICEDAPERKNIALIVKQGDQLELFSRVSNLSKLKRIIAYCLRFIRNAKRKQTDRILESLTCEELQGALNIIVRQAQHDVYAKEISDLKKNSTVGRKSKLLSLNPILDENMIIRVGGRIHQSNFNYNKRHPMILPASHRLTYMIIENEHIRQLHCGANHLLASLREKFWPISGKNLVKRVIRECIVCFRANPRATNPLMGALPKARLSPALPFQNCGLDYAGPVIIKDRKGRGCKTSKAYICIFICFITKAVHLELVTDLTTEACLAAIRRFTSRRGLPLNIYSDNATNFVGTNSELRNFYNMLNDQKSKISTNLSNLGISWHFIPPRSPHFGGLWEAGVKSVKAHLKRVAGNALLTFEEYYTLLTQIEAVLNSRPLSPLSMDPNDLNPLTPSHFLIGRSITSPPEPSLINESSNRLSKFQHIQKIKQDFWKRWSKEYISELQVRTKWKTNNQSAIRVGVLVLVKDDNLPPLKWKLGRITEVHPGTDGIIRVVSLKTNRGTIVKRAVSRVCVLPIYD